MAVASSIFTAVFLNLLSENRRSVQQNHGRGPQRDITTASLPAGAIEGTHAFSCGYVTNLLKYCQRMRPECGTFDAFLGRCRRCTRYSPSEGQRAQASSHPSSFD